MKAQYPLHFEPRAEYAVEDFLISDANRAALTLVREWPNWAGPSAAIWGPEGSGKTHLAHIWAARADARILSLADFDALAMDDLASQRRFVLDFGSTDAPQPDERRLFHFLNIMREAQGALLIVARAAPSRWAIALPDLSSRLKALPAANVSSPDDGLFAAVLAKQFADRQLVVDGEVIMYLAHRSERSFAAARTLVAKLDQAALASRRPIGKRLAREVLAEIEGAQQP